MPEPLDVAAVRARVEAATLGPWRTNEPGPYIHSVWGFDTPDDVNQAAPVAKMLGPADARFIAHARTDVPALLDALEAAQAENERLRAEMVPRSALVQVGWCGPYGIVPGGLDQDHPVPEWWIPVYVIRTDSEESA